MVRAYRDGFVAADDHVTLPRRQTMMQNFRSAQLPVWSWKNFFTAHAAPVARFGVSQVVDAFAALN